MNNTWRKKIAPRIINRWMNMSNSESRAAEACGELRGVCVRCMGKWMGKCGRAGNAVDEAATIHGG